MHDLHRFCLQLQSFFALIMAAQGAGQAAGMAGDQAKGEQAKRAIFALIDTVSPIDPFAPGYTPSGTGAVAVAIPSPAVASYSGPTPTVAGKGDSGAQQYAPPPSAPGDIGGAVSFSHVSFAYPTRPDTTVLNDFSLDIRPGQVVALVSLTSVASSNRARDQGSLHCSQRTHFSAAGRPERLWQEQRRGSAGALVRREGVGVGGGAARVMVALCMIMAPSAIP